MDYAPLQWRDALEKRGEGKRIRRPRSSSNWMSVKRVKLDFEGKAMTEAKKGIREYEMEMEMNLRRGLG